MKLTSMKVAITPLLFFIFLGCKKETHVANSLTDSISYVKEAQKDSLIKEQQDQGFFVFDTELCTNKGYFDESKYTRDQLEATYKLYYKFGGILLSSPHVFKLTDLQEVRRDKDQILKKLEKEFKEKKKAIENLQIVNVPYWQDIKKQTLQALVQEYAAEKTQIIAYSDPSVLLKDKYSENCERFIKALNSNDTEMTEEWRKLREEMSKKNGDPQNVMNEFENRLNSPDRKDYAIMDLIVFGWGNCVNDDIQRPEHNTEMNKNFNSLFIKVDAECDEP
ncbi:hypothetical protein [Chryseobacterium tongliaoense]|uniref:hypothetical protein n=1 Tax=Chryseobacterium tongliaoense TaxID=3240933 RepID=UPI00351215DC